MKEKNIYLPNHHLVRAKIAWLVFLGILFVFGSPIQFADGQQRNSAQDAPMEPTGDAPWNRSAAPAMAGERPADPRSLFVNLDDSHLRLLEDGAALGPDDDETLARVLIRVPIIDLATVDHYRRKTRNTSLRDVAEKPDQHRLHFFRLNGRVRRVEKVELLPELARRFAFSHYYLVSMDLDESPQTASRRVKVCARRVPKAWLDAGSTNITSMNEPARVDSLFFKVGDRGSPSTADPNLVFAADRMAWLPERPVPGHGVTPDHLLLAELGMDIGLFEDIADRDGREGLAAADRECFFQLLAAAGRTNNDELSQQADPVFDLIRLLQKPRASHGKLLMIDATARRVTRIDVTEEGVRRRWGIDHYYQIDAFVKLDRPVQLGRKKSTSSPSSTHDPSTRQEKDSAAPVFRNQYPVTICVRQLPSGLIPSGNARMQNELKQPMRLPAFHFRIWSYQSGFAEKFDSLHRQPSPLFVGHSPRLVSPRRHINPAVGVAVGVLFLVALTAVWIGLWRSHKNDARFTKSTLRRQFELKKGASLNQLDVPVSDEPQ